MPGGGDQQVDDREQVLLSQKEGAESVSGGLAVAVVLPGTRGGGHGRWL